MFGSLGFNEILFIMVLALLIFGPKRLPQIGRTIGKTMGEFRRATNDLKQSMEVEMTLAEERDRAAKRPEVKAASGTLARGEATPEEATSKTESGEAAEMAAIDNDAGPIEPDWGVPEPHAGATGSEVTDRGEAAMDSPSLHEGANAEERHASDPSPAPDGGAASDEGSTSSDDAVPDEHAAAGEDPASREDPAAKAPEGS